MATTALAENLVGNTAAASSAPNSVGPSHRMQRFLVAGEPAVRDDGSLDAGIEAQMQRAWQKLFSAMKAAGFEKRHLRSTTMYLTVGGQVRAYRRVRDRMLERLPVPCSCLHVDGLATAGSCVEIEGEASRD